MKSQNLKYLLFINFASLVGFYTFVPLYALFAHNLAMDPRTIGLIWSGYSLETAVFVLLMGKWQNGRAKENVVAAGYLLCALGAFAFLLVHNEVSLLAVLTLNALGAGVTLPAYKTLFAKGVADGRESEHWSWFDAGNMFAAALGAAIGGFIIGIFGFSGLFITMGTIQLLAAAAAYKCFCTTVTA